jgi:hypothetical protein
MSQPVAAPASAGLANSCKPWPPCYSGGMTIEDIEKAVAELPPDQFARFRDWFERFDAARFDRKIERDAAAGKLDRFAEQAIDDFRKGRAREL